MSWQDIKHLFQSDVGSLPDIFIENLSESELEAIYSWVMSLTEPFGDPLVWSIREEKDIAVKELHDSPASLFLAGEVEQFRHALEPFAYDGVLIPQLSIAIEDNSTISFDYRMGPDWGESQVKSLFKFLLRIKSIAPTCSIHQSWEGEEHRNKEFENELHRISTA